MFTHKSPFIKNFIAEKSQSLLLERLNSSAKAFLLSQLKHKNILILSEGKRKEALYNDLSFFSKRPIIEIPSWDTFFEEDLKPSKDILGKRMSAIQSILEEKTKIVMAPLACALQKIPSSKVLSQSLKTIEKGQSYCFDAFIQLLHDLGYQRSSIVSDKGQFSVRGGIIDVFPISMPIAVRIEFFSDEIEEIRTFDTADQRSVEKIPSFFLSPAQEKPLLDTETETLLQYLGKDTLIIFDELVELEEDYIPLKQKLSKFHISLDDFLASSKTLKKIFFSKENIEKIGKVSSEEKARDFENLSFEWADKSITTKRLFHPIIEIEDFSSDGIDNLQSYYVGKKENPDFTNATFVKGSITKGFVLMDGPLAVYAEDGPQFVRRDILRQSFHTPSSAYHMLTVGDSVVHSHSGIGKFLGIEKQKNATGAVSEFIALEFAENSKLFVPLSQSHLVSKYIGSGEVEPALSKLGSKKWEKTKFLAQKQILGYAKDLLEIQAARVMEGGFAFPGDTDDMYLFEDSFPYTETQDQLLAIDAVKKDMQKPEAMDRLILGDVGYGKTEVAIRAAFKAAYEGKKQVCVLVPTTVLAMQHYESFSKRLKDFPLRVEALYRHQKNPKKIVQEIKNGSIDIIISTHRILSKDIAFKDLGLLIIDEEQRFGVRAKEHLKKVKKGADCLTLSATPIPRTLYMSIIQIRDMSTISTPPHDRLPIQTIICENDDKVIQNALLREHLREGQSYVIHNRVETIAERKDSLQKLLPQAKIAYVHGQMTGDQVDRIFCAFKAQEIDILVATTLIESGVDVPNANTLIVDNAQRFGLSDLYQLRGRVGRWNRPAYAYFVIPKKKKPSEEQKMRLSVLAETSGYGGGMKIAMRDLEIRGAGDILGTKQSGQISQIGFHLYCKLLKQTISSLKQKRPFILQETKMEFSFPAYIPEDYIQESSLRMEMYHKLGDTQNFKQIEKILEEIEDRFGKAPDPVYFFYHLMRIKIFCTQNYFTHLKFQNISFFAKQDHRKNVEEKNLMLPKNLQKPNLLESAVIERLQKNFACPNFF